MKHKKRLDQVCKQLGLSKVISDAIQTLSWVVGATGYLPEDARQDLLMTVIHIKKTVADVSDTYLLKCLHNKANNLSVHYYLRSRKSATRHPTNIDDMHNLADPRPTENIAQLERHMERQSLLKLLRKDETNSVTCIIYEMLLKGCTPPEIKEALDIPKTTMYYHLNRIKEVAKELT